MSSPSTGTPVPDPAATPSTTSSATSTATSSATPSATVTPEAHVPLDEVMLAMDVVDTLRHQQALVQAELGEDERRQRLIARIQSIYESQGMEVTEAVIAEGVKALAEDRFTYEPPQRGFQVRLAEVYVERGKWTKRLAVVALIAVLAWLAYAIPAHLNRQSLIEGFERQVSVLEQQASDLGRRASRLRDRIEAARDSLSSESSAGVDILDGAERSLQAANKDLQGLTVWLKTSPDPQTYPEQQVRLDGVLAEQRKALSSAQSDLGTAEDKLTSLQHLHRISAELTQVFARLRGIQVPSEVMQDLTRQRDVVESAVQAGKVKEADQGLSRLRSQVSRVVQAHQQRASREAELKRLRGRAQAMPLDADSKAAVTSLVARVRQALKTNDDRVASRDLAALKSLVAELDMSYELRIVTRSNTSSGVWRRKNNNPRVRNYYIIVEAIAKNGRRLSLRVLNEETQRTHRVRSFGIRVKKSVYERVKQDKLDNGIIDNRLFGVKKRGTRRVEYRFPVEGGRITRW